METHHGVSQHDNGAKTMLEVARRAESETRNPQLPWTFFVTQAVLLAAVCVAQLLPGTAAILVTILGLISLMAVGAWSVFARKGYGFVWPDGYAAFPFILAMLILVGIPAIVAIGLHVQWLWLVAGAFALMATLEMGRRYRRSLNRDSH
ncbi:hypothetical protein [Haematomicrobium sanguinis]|uniref:hypothetical protein n=1 Tax=Haematomicrobium sanguinis TaxID=479106 RepID=UPI0012FCE229|nr:hypothetical protein [Haematomicrobium sanguinis]